VIWFDFPMRLRTALKSLCCLAHSDAAMQSLEISARTGVSRQKPPRSRSYWFWAGSLLHDAEPKCLGCQPPLPPDTTLKR
jgi:hypothetical protein